jgi:hypothetical protein
MKLRFPERWYPRFKRAMWRWVYSAHFSDGKADVQLRWRS